MAMASNRWSKLSKPAFRIETARLAEKLMNGARDININQLTDNLPVRGFTWVMLALCIGAMLSEGYNLGVPGLAAPGILKSFAVTRSDIAPVFSAALFGMLVGTLVAGYSGDRFGRKHGILLSTAVIGVASFGCALAANLSQLLWLRFAVGMGLGGLLPNVAALIAELTPRRLRATFISYSTIGIIGGGTLPGLASAQFAGGDWRLLFAIGGLISLAVFVPILIYLPESPKFLALDAARAPRLRIVLKILLPELDLGEHTRFVLAEKQGRFSPSQLFMGALRWITPALWLADVMVMLVNFFINSWLALVLADIGFSAPQAATLTTFYYVGGICGAFLCGTALDFVGPAALALYALVGAGAIFLVSLPTGSFFLTGLLAACIGFGVLGAQAGITAILGLVYPTPIRAKGAGIAHSVGRLGGISGPLLAGILMAQHTSVAHLFLLPALAIALAAPCFLVVTGAWTGRLLGRGLAAIEAVPGL